MTKTTFQEAQIALSKLTPKELENLAFFKGLEIMIGADFNLLQKAGKDATKVASSKENLEIFCKIIAEKQGDFFGNGVIIQGGNLEIISYYMINMVRNKENKTKNYVFMEMDIISKCSNLIINALEKLEKTERFTFGSKQKVEEIVLKMSAKAAFQDFF